MSNIDKIFAAAAVCAAFIPDPFMLLLVAFMWYFWEDSQWPAFDSKGYNKKVMQGSLKPWQKGN